MAGLTLKDREEFARRLAALDHHHRLAVEQCLHYGITSKAKELARWRAEEEQAEQAEQEPQPQMQESSPSPSASSSPSPETSTPEAEPPRFYVTARTIDGPAVWTRHGLLSWGSMDEACALDLDAAAAVAIQLDAQRRDAPTGEAYDAAPHNVAIRPFDNE